MNRIPTSRTCHAFLARLLARLLASLLGLALLAPSRVAAQDPPPSHYSDPPPLEFVDAGWESWPTWAGEASDQTPSNLCTTGEGASIPPPEAGGFGGTQDDAEPWKITVATWNLLNLGLSKAYWNQATKDPERKNLLDRLEQIIRPYDVLVFQEILADWGNAFPGPLHTRLQAAGFTCQLITPATGWAGRQEHFGVCNKAANGTVQSIAVTARSTTTPTCASPPCYDPPVTGAAKACAQKIWMRPPGWVSIRVVPKGQTPTPVTFNLLVNHLKPSYNRSFLPAGGKSPVTPTWYPAARPASFPVPTAATTWPLNNASVFFELTALEKNLGQWNMAQGNSIIVGDLNAACGYLPAYQEKAVFKTWSWTPAADVRTNTGRVVAGSPSGVTPQTAGGCAYDRFILNPAARSFLQGTFIHSVGIPDRVDGKQVSDHFLVLIELGAGKPKVSTGMLTVKVDNKRKNSFDVEDASGAKKAKLGGTGIHLGGSASSPQVFVASYNNGTVYSRSARIPLTDVRKAGPTPVDIAADGTLTARAGSRLDWDIGPGDKGVYKLVLDVDGDGIFDATAGDLVNGEGGYDVLVYDHTMVVSDVSLSTVDNDGRSRDTFSAGKAHVIALLARDITPPASGEVDVYVVSHKLLQSKYPQFTNWSGAGALGISLPTVATPVNFRRAPPILIDQLQPTELKSTFEVAADGSLFASVWSVPQILMNTRVYPSAVPPPLPDLPEDRYGRVAIFGDGCADLTPRQSGLTEAEFAQICQGGGAFTATYGTRYSVVIDIDGNGTFGGPDRVDNPDLSAVSNYLNEPGNPTLGPGTNASSAVVRQVQKYLLSRMDHPTSPTVTLGTFDAGTGLLAQALLCSRTIDKDLFTSKILPSSQVGFLVLSEDDYEIEKQDGRHVNLFLQDTTLSAGISCVRASESLTADDVRYDHEVTFSSSGPILLSGSHHVTRSGGRVQFVATPTLTGPSEPRPPVSRPVMVLHPETEIRLPLEQAGMSILGFVLLVALL